MLVYLLFLPFFITIFTKKIQEIDNTSTGTYQGDRKPAELRARLESFRGTFENAVDQIIKSATDIKVMATVKENE